MVDYRRNDEEIQFNFGPEPTNGGGGGGGGTGPTDGGREGDEETAIRINADNLANLVITSAISAGVGAVLFGGRRDG